MLKEIFQKASRQEGTPSARLITAVLRERPDLADATFYVPSKGRSACVVMTETEVFKSMLTKQGDKNPDAVLERDIQDYLHGKGLPVPKMTCVDKNDAFFGMERIVGERLGFLDISRREIIEDMLYQEGKFIADVETATLSADFDHIRARMARPSQNAAAKQSLDTLKRKSVQAAIGDPAVLALLEQQAEKLIAAMPVLVHNDMLRNNSNIILKNNGQCTFVDFGCATLACSVYDELGMHWREDRENVVRGYLDSQSRRTRADILCEHFLERMAIVSGGSDGVTAWCKRESQGLAKELHALGAIGQEPGQSKNQGGQPSRKNGGSPSGLKK